MKSAKRANADEPILVPGDKERSVKADRLANGVPMSEETWGDIVKTACNVGMEQAEIDEIAAPMA